MDQKYQCHLVSPGPPRTRKLEHFHTSRFPRMESRVTPYVCSAIVRNWDVILVVISKDPEKHALKFKRAIDLVPTMSQLPHH